MTSGFNTNDVIARYDTVMVHISNVIDVTAASSSLIGWSWSDAAFNTRTTSQMVHDNSRMANIVKKMLISVCPCDVVQPMGLL